jgi:hypothetical protein
LRIDVDIERNAFLFGNLVKARQEVKANIFHRLVGDVDGHCARFDFGNIENIVDQYKQVEPAE